MPDQAVKDEKSKVDEPAAMDNNQEKRDINPAVTRERIERLKKAFRPNWLLDAINEPDKKHSKKDK